MSLTPPRELCTPTAKLVLDPTSGISVSKGKSDKEYQMMTTQNYIEMLSYMRPEGTKAQRKFCNRFLLPVFGEPDDRGNYILRVGNPTVAFMSHHDTVHRNGGMQNVIINQSFNFATTTENCLGADCTTGVYIMLRMIEAGVEGLYIVHTAEEVGCRGSSYIVYHTPEVVDGIQAAVSFDRYGYNSIITHQSGVRTCSEQFSDSLADILQCDYKSDRYGSYTDSNEYRGIIPECTNISVGYFDQHSKKESQDLDFLEIITDSCINADWSKLEICRNPSKPSTDWDLFDTDTDKATYSEYDDDVDFDPDMEQLIAERPKSVAILLQSHGYDVNELEYALSFVRDGYYPQSGN